MSGSRQRTTAFWILAAGLGAASCATQPPAATDQSLCPMGAAVEAGASLPSVISRVNLDPAAVRGLRGFACARVTIGPDGSVRAVEMLTQSNRVVGEEFARALRKWTFQPAMKDGQPIESSMTLSVNIR